MANQWYSDGMTFKEAKYLNRAEAGISDPRYVSFGTSQWLAFELELNRHKLTYTLISKDDIKELLTRTQSESVSELEGAVVEIYAGETGIRAISVTKKQ